MVNDMTLEEAFRKIAVDISEYKCGGGGCPCYETCVVYTDEECINKLMDYFKYVIGDAND